MINGQISNSSLNLIISVSGSSLILGGNVTDYARNQTVILSRTGLEPLICRVVEIFPFSNTLVVDALPKMVDSRIVYRSAIENYALYATGNCHLPAGQVTNTI